MSHFGHFNLNSVLEFKVHSAWLSGKIGSAEKRYLDEACAVETIRVKDRRCCVVVVLFVSSASVHDGKS